MQKTEFSSPPRGGGVRCMIPESLGPLSAEVAVVAVVVVLLYCSTTVLIVPVQSIAPALRHSNAIVYLVCICWSIAAVIINGLDINLNESGTHGDMLQQQGGGGSGSDLSPSPCSTPRWFVPCFWPPVCPLPDVRSVQLPRRLSVLFLRRPNAVGKQRYS